MLTTAEKLGVLLQWLGVPADEAILWRAWEPLLFNHAHDLMSGVMTDHVYDDTLRGYDFSHRIANDEVQARLRAASAAIDTQGEGIAIAVWNTLSWPRTDLAVAQVGISDAGVTDVGLVGPDGQAVPVQLLDGVRSPNGALIRANVAFVARDVPALGYSVYRLLPLRTRRPTSAAAQPQDQPVLENEFYRLEFDPASGAMKSLTAKSSGWNVLSGPGNVVAREEDRGDLWELYKNLEMGFVTNKTPHPAPQPGKAVFSSEHSATPGTIQRGPVLSEFKVAHPFGGDNQFATRVRLIAGLRRIEIRTQLLNNEKSVRYRVLFPTSIRDGQSYHEIPFGAVATAGGNRVPGSELGRLWQRRARC